MSKWETIWNGLYQWVLVIVGIIVMISIYCQGRYPSPEFWSPWCSPLQMNLPDWLRWGTIVLVGIGVGLELYCIKKGE